MGAGKSKVVKDSEVTRPSALSVIKEEASVSGPSERRTQKSIDTPKLGSRFSKKSKRTSVSANKTNVKIAVDSSSGLGVRGGGGGGGGAGETTAKTEVPMKTKLLKEGFHRRTNELNTLTGRTEAIREGSTTFFATSQLLIAAEEAKRTSRKKTSNTINKKNKKDVPVGAASSSNPLSKNRSSTNADTSRLIIPNIGGLRSLDNPDSRNSKSTNTDANSKNVEENDKTRKKSKPTWNCGFKQKKE